ncbi:hypothetical protein [Brevibacterium litoralis]|uniref:hypothetical protein n=1 Tax=Brevibacterium litoralis TaxID=3138935 RepID=UPI0032EDB74C
MTLVLSSRKLVDRGVTRKGREHLLRCCLEPVLRGVYRINRECRRHSQTSDLLDKKDLTVLKRLASGSPVVRDKLMRTVLIHAFEVSPQRDAVAARGTWFYSHRTAAHLLGLESALPSAPTIDVTRPGRNQSSGVVRWFGMDEISPGHMVEVGGRAMTSIARTCLDIGADEGLKLGLPMADAAIRAEKLERVDLESCLVDHPRAHRRDVRAVAALASGLSESVGESLTRVALHRLGIVDQWGQQVWIETDIGRRRIDFANHSTRVALEFDGYGKYFEKTPEGRASLKEQYRRDQALLRAGWFPVHVDWETVLDLDLFRRTLQNARK